MYATLLPCLHYPVGYHEQYVLQECTRNPTDMNRFATAVTKKTRNGEGRVSSGREGRVQKRTLLQFRALFLFRVRSLSQNQKCPCFTPTGVLGGRFCTEFCAWNHRWGQHAKATCVRGYLAAVNIRATMQLHARTQQTSWRHLCMTARSSIRKWPPRTSMRVQHGDILDFRITFFLIRSSPWRRLSQDTYAEDKQRANLQ